MIEERMFIFEGYAGNGEAFLLCDCSIIFAVFVQPGDLAPVNVSPFVRLPVKHVRIDPTYRKPAVVYAAFAFIEKPARSAFIILHLK